MIDPNNPDLYCENGKLYTIRKEVSNGEEKIFHDVVDFIEREQAKAFAKSLRKTKRFSWVRIKKRQQSEKTWRGEWLSPYIWFEIEAYPREKQYGVGQ
jgi:hypothetical protein